MRKRLFRCWCVASGLAMAVTLGVATPARAASPLVASDPAPHDVVAEQPGWLTLAFSRTVDQKVLKVLVLNEAGDNVALDDYEYYGSSVLVQLNDEVRPGTFTVMWRIDRPDGQPEGGSFQFAWNTSRWTNDQKASWSGTAEQPPLLGTVDAKNPEPEGTPQPEETGPEEPWPDELGPDETDPEEVYPDEVETPGPDDVDPEEVAPEETAPEEGAPSSEPSDSTATTQARPVSPAPIPWVWLAVAGAAVVVVLGGGAVAWSLARRRAKGRHGRPGG